MKKFAHVTAAAAVAAVALGSVATSASAQGYYGRGGYGYDNGYRNPCQQAQKSRGNQGAVIGALAGAALGSNMAGRGDRTAGTLIGALAGAAVGSNIAKGSGKTCDRWVEQRYGYGDRYGYGYSQRGYDRGYRGYGYDRRW